MKIGCLLLAAYFLAVHPAFGALNDGFGDALTLETPHFTVHYKKDVDLQWLIDQLSLSPADLTLTGQKIDTSSLQAQLASKLEILFQRTCDVLDMHVGSYKGSIKVFANKEELQAYFHKAYPDLKMPCTGVSFYAEDYKSVYISSDNFRREVLGHEIGHALISSYFVVSPSVKIQEVLAGYVEYQLKKVPAR